MEMTTEQKGRLEYIRTSLKASAAEVAPFNSVTQIHDDYQPIMVPLIVLQMTTGDEPIKTAIAADVLISDDAASEYVHIYQRENKLALSPAYVTPKPKAEPAKETVVIGYEYPKGSGFYVGQGGWQDYDPGDRIAYTPPGGVAKSGYAIAGEYIREDLPMGKTPFSAVLRGWRKAD